MRLDLNNENINVDGRVDIEDISEDEKVSDEELEAFLEEIAEDIDKELEEIHKQVENEEDSQEIKEIYATDDVRERMRIFNKYNPDAAITYDLGEDEE